MAYIDELLGRGENILFVARQHVFVLISHLVTEFIVIALLVAAAVASHRAFLNNPEPLLGGMPASTLIPLICGLLSLFVLISGLLDFLRWNIEQYVVTDRRVIQVHGLIGKRTIDSSLSKINDVALRQNLLGRLFNFGTIEILTASEEADNIIDRVETPLEFKRAMLDAKFRYEHGYSMEEPAIAANHKGHMGFNQIDLQNTLEELAMLRDRGILSIDEFEAKKRELLNRI